MWVGVSELGEIVRIDPMTYKVSGALAMPALAATTSQPPAPPGFAGGCIDKKTNRVVERAAIQGPGGGRSR